MRTLIFSDTHLTDHFDQLQCDYIVKLVKSVDKVIINGDFWDGYLTTFDKFLVAWEPLLHVLAKHDVLYILGNHDNAVLTDERAKKFATVLDGQYTFAAGSTSYRVAHGHMQSREFDVEHPQLTKYFGWFYPIFPIILNLPYCGTWLRARNQRAKRKLEYELMQFTETRAQKHEVYVFGHSHLMADNSAIHYVNPGSFTPRIARFIIIDDTGHQLFADSI